MIQFKSVADMQMDIVNNIHLLPRDIDLIVGIPRSGMLAASLIALHLNLPLSEIGMFSAGLTMPSGGTRCVKNGDIKTFRHALIVDDSERSGRSMLAARAKLSSTITKSTFCVVYGTDDNRSVSDIALRRVATPRIFEWNIFHHPMLENCCVDIDGVLCRDPTKGENDDGPLYRQFLLSSEILRRPTVTIGTLVTSRLEKYRSETEQWLANHGILYHELMMLDLPDAETRSRLGAHGSFKAGIYKRSGRDLFIESEAWQASQIALISGRDVLSLEGMQMIRADGIGQIPHGISKSRFFWTKMARYLAKLGKRSARRFVR